VLCLDYDLEIPSLKRLITLTNRANWSPDEIEWQRPLSKRGDYEPILEWHGFFRNEYVQSLPHATREALARQMVAVEFSQILHGEQAALMLAGQLTSSVNDLDARIFAANQARDESRHVQAVRGLVQRIGPIYPCGAVLKENLEALLVCDLWPKQVLGLQLFLEARALLSFREALLFVRDPLFREVTGLIERDEAHHVAFGIQYLKTGIDELSPEERRDLVDYTKHLDANLWALMRPEELGQAFEELDLDYQECLSYQKTSFTAPLIAGEKRASVDTMHAQFKRWFRAAIKRVGLEDALDASEGDATEELTLPWLPKD
jgi:hypothetical protein